MGVFFVHIAITQTTFLSFLSAGYIKYKCLRYVQKLWHKQFHVVLWDNNEIDTNVCQVFT